MVFIKKGRAPKLYDEYIQTQRATGVRILFDDIPGDVKEKLRAGLLEEQGYICAYCMKRIGKDKNAGSSKVKIEHYEARNEINSLDYDNLLAVCDGNEGKPHARQTCDTRKGQEMIRINPQRREDMETIYYKGPYIHSNNSNFEHDLNDTLNLNDDMGFLVSGRKSALDSLKAQLKKRKINGTYSRRLLENLMNKKNKDGSLQPYVGILRWYLQRKLRQLSN